MCVYGGGERVGHTCRCTAEVMLRGGGGYWVAIGTGFEII